MTAIEFGEHIRKCLGVENVSIVASEPFKSGSGCDVLDCEFVADGVASRGVLKVYRQGFDDYSGIGSLKTVRKNVLVGRELPAYGINIPAVMGAHLSGEPPCVLVEKLEGTGWDGQTRILAAERLARFHSIHLEELSAEFQEVVTQSRPNMDRVRLGVAAFCENLDKTGPGWRKERVHLAREATEIVEDNEPRSSLRTLVHGDYFSVNIIPTTQGIYIVDWDLLAMGDPMWDLGFLIGADRDVTDEEAEAAVAAYRRYCEVDEGVLSWHRQCWRVFRALMELARV